MSAFVQYGKWQRWCDWKYKQVPVSSQLSLMWAWGGRHTQPGCCGWLLPHRVCILDVKWCQHYLGFALSLFHQFLHWTAQPLICWPVLFPMQGSIITENKAILHSPSPIRDRQQQFSLHIASCSPCRLLYLAWATFMGFSHNLVASGVS